METVLSKIQLKRLGVAEAPVFLALTYPALRQHLLPLTDACRAVGAFDDDGKPIGLALATGVGGNAKLASLFVAPTYRNRGLGSALIKALTLEVVRTSSPIISTGIVGSTPSREAFDRALVSAGWPALQLAQFKVLGRAKTMSETVQSWTSMQRVLAREDTVFAPWASFGATDHTAFQQLMQQPAARFPGDPFMWTETLLPDLSVVIRRAGRAVGWVIACRGRSSLKNEPETPTIDYKSSYIDEDLHHTVILIAGHCQIFMRQVEIYGENSLAQFWATGDRMIHFSRNRFAPISVECEEVWQSGVYLPGPDATSAAPVTTATAETPAA